jgi:putative protease
MPAVGDSIRLHRGDDSGRLSHKVQYTEPAENGFWLSIPDGFDKGDHVYLIQTKAMSKRYRPVIAHAAKADGQQQPGFEKAPQPRLTEKQPLAKKSAVFPEGLYVAVSSINDLFIVQSSRPARVMVNLTRKTANYLLGTGKPPLPFKKTEILLVLDPFFPQAAAEYLHDIVPQLVEAGYQHYVINNPGHLPLFRELRPDVRLIAGPWLYTFNAWSLSFVADWGVDAVASPLENNRQNLERTVERYQFMRPLVLVPVFGWPPLFRIRGDLGAVYDFKSFTDNRDEQFSLVCERESSLVIPEKPFSITDKIPFLKEAGFRRFIIDLSGPPLKKNDYKDLMRAVESGAPLPRMSRFNWKDGFFAQPS